MSDLYASGNAPGTEYSPSETGGVYHEDREVTVSGGPGSQMFRVYGAQFSWTSQQWTLQAGATVAYATVQNPDGSIHYFTWPGYSPWSNSEWLGSDNNTIYNAVDFGATAGGTAAVNLAALTALFTAMPIAAAPALGGGMARIPQYNFPVFASSAGLPVPPGPGGSGDNVGGCIIQGLGTGGQSGMNAAFHFSINDPIVGGPNIFLYCDGPHTSGGTFFKNLAFQWVTPGYAGDTCLYLNYWNNGVDSCTFTDCPIAMNFQGLGGSATRCTIDYGKNITTPANTTAILVAGIQTEISGPSEMKGGYVSGATTAACIGIGGTPAGSVHNTLRNLHIYGWNYGVDYSGLNGTGNGNGTSDTLIDGCQFEITNTAINMQPGSSSNLIFNQTISNCTIEKDRASADGAAIVYIDSAGGAATNVGPISLVNNVIFSNVTGSGGAGEGVAQKNQYGVQIGTCANVSILGGRISQCGTTEYEGSDGTANICISGNPSAVTVTAVDLNGVYPGANSGGSTGTYGSAASEYALLISGNPSIVKVTDCFMSGTSGYSVSITGDPETVRLTNCTFGTSALSVTGSPASLIVTNCTGYNDQNTPINTLAHITTGTAYSAATQGSNSGTSYYGSSLVMFTAANSIGGTFQVNGGTAQTLLPLQFVTVFLNSPYDTIQFNTHAPSAFSWTGK